MVVAAEVAQESPCFSEHDDVDAARARRKPRTAPAGPQPASRRWLTPHASVGERLKAESCSVSP